MSEGDFGVRNVDFDERFAPARDRDRLSSVDGDLSLVEGDQIDLVEPIRETVMIETPRACCAVMIARGSATYVALIATKPRANAWSRFEMNDGLHSTTCNSTTKSLDRYLVVPR